MKNILLLALILITQTCFAQLLTETRTAALVGGDYVLNGTVYLEAFDDGSLDLRFDTDYMTQSNVFDVHVFLSNSNDYSTPIDTSGMLLVENIGTQDGLNYSSGAMSFDLPIGVGINDYQHIVFVCVAFGQLHWGNGEFEEVVSTGIFENDAPEHHVKLFPNPSENGIINIQFERNQQNVLLELLNTNGQIISSDRLIGIQNHLIELKATGAYFLRMTSDEATTVRRIVKL